MGTKQTHPVGSFCWFELGTSDQDAAKEFYSGLFGWEWSDSPMGEGLGVYTMFQQQGLDVCGAFGLQPEQQPGVPPHWMTYIAVENAQETIVQAAKLGATILAPAFDVFDFGRMAVLQDPTGAVFSLWQPGTHQGADVMMLPNTVGWNELVTRDVGRAKAFYTELFGWTLHPGNAGGVEYTEIENARERCGGMIGMDGPEWENIPPHWMIYFIVADCEAIADQAVQLGGWVNVEPTVIPNVGKFAVIADPQGAVFSVVELSPQN